METQIKSFYQTGQELKFVSIFGYASRGIPALEINGVGKFSKNMKEKMIYLTRTRKLKIPQRRYVICVEQNDLDKNASSYYQWLEFPLLLMYWHLSGLVPITNLDDCITNGRIKPNGEVIHDKIPLNFSMLLSKEFEQCQIENYKYIGLGENQNLPCWVIQSNLLLDHVPKLIFKHS